MKKFAWGLAKLTTALSLFILLIVLSACSQSSTGAANTSKTTSETLPSSTAASTAPAGGSSGKGSISARIDGVQWSSIVTAAQYTNTGLIISGADNSNPPHALGLGVAAVAPGTYQITLPNPTANASWTVGPSTWQASLIGGSGTVTITSLTSTGAAGTFSFTMVAVPNTAASGSKAITDGVFNVTFASPATIPAQTAAGTATITAQVNGEAFSGITLQATYQNQSLAITGFDPKSGQITLNVYKVTGPGIYSVAYQNPEGSSAIYASSTGQGSNTFLPGGTGSVNITTLTAAEAVGTFSFDAPSATGSSGSTTHVTNGRFDVSFK
jgi:hypothetical protein